MKKLLLILLIAAVAVITFSHLRRSAVDTQAAVAAETVELQALTNRIAEEQRTNALLRGELQAKQNHLRMVARHTGVTPELLALAEKDFANGSPAAWAQLRQQLGIGWNSS